MDDGHKTYTLDGLEEKYDEDIAKSVLSLNIDEMVFTGDIAKGIQGASVYQFDLETPEGITKTMELLPVLSEEVLTDILIEIWPGANADASEELKRAEIRGFLMDYANEAGFFAEDFESPGDFGTGATEPEGMADPAATGTFGDEEIPGS